jgi:hypothetical protein
LRGSLAAGILGLIAYASPAWGSGPQATEVLALDAPSPSPEPTSEAVLSGSLDAFFRPLTTARISHRSGARGG